MRQLLSGSSRRAKYLERQLPLYGLHVMKECKKCVWCPIGYHISRAKRVMLLSKYVRGWGRTLWMKVWSSWFFQKKYSRATWMLKQSALPRLKQCSRSERDLSLISTQRRHQGPEVESATALVTCTMSRKSFCRVRHWHEKADHLKTAGGCNSAQAWELIWCISSNSTFGSLLW